MRAAVCRHERKVGKRKDGEGPEVCPCKGEERLSEARQKVV